MINKETQLCMSLAARPGNFGTRFHNYLYQKLDLNYIYKAFTTQDLAAAIGGIRALAIRGCAISMPFKEACIAYLDDLDPSARNIDSVNTIVNDMGRLKGYNTDYIAVAALLASNQLNPSSRFVLKGSGGMAKAVAGALYHSGFTNGLILARNPVKGAELAALYHYQFSQDEAALNPHTFDILINVTPVGMSGGAEAGELAFSETLINAAHIIFDVVALPVVTPLIQYATEQGKKIISGADVIALQALEQFVLYTGVRPPADLVNEAAQFARAS